MVLFTRGHRGDWTKASETPLSKREKMVSARRRMLPVMVNERRMGEQDEQDDPEIPARQMT